MISRGAHFEGEASADEAYSPGSGAVQVMSDRWKRAILCPTTRPVPLLKTFLVAFVRVDGAKRRPGRRENFLVYDVPERPWLGWCLNYRGFCALFGPVALRGSNPDVYVIGSDGVLVFYHPLTSQNRASLLGVGSAPATTVRENQPEVDGRTHTTNTPRPPRQDTHGQHWSWCCLYFLLGLFVFSLISRRFVFSVTSVRPFLFSRHVINQPFQTVKCEKEKMHLDNDNDNEAKCLFIKTKKQQQTLEKPTARFVVRGGRGLGPAASQSSL